MRDWVFDQPEARSLREARQAFLLEVLAQIELLLALETALDAGCGIGYFAAALNQSGLEVAAFDARTENIEEARRRFPQIRFHCANIEDSAVLELGTFDVTVCFGLLYHLENPLRALRNLYSMTKKVLLVE